MLGAASRDGASESCFLLVGIKDLFPTIEAEGVTSSSSLSLTAEAPQEVSYIGQDCREIPEHLGRDCGHFAKRLDLSFNLLSLSGPILDTPFISLEAQYSITVYYASSKCTGRGREHLPFLECGDKLHYVPSSCPPYVHALWNDFAFECELS
ncbi:hypothetical protein MG293_020545 [Ovis ammon polii]|uniref:Uncharacterized protein n=1 Tax=Ovis ammon polii TaxID=230172 RepID=A0AAD4TMQ3_OVIAM|nr:hypothetical protein MG293_020545 [Ovis ammon polii]KAI4550164.1 hypothetical protein MJT46_018890 [Ovis ammon polii x Ovis aries]